MTIKEINPENRERALALVLSVFMQYEAPDYSEQGIRTFTDFINNKEATDNLQMYGAFMNGELVGVIATRNSGNHIALFFVDSKYHRQGIGRKLFEKAAAVSTADNITVNSSPFAVAVYQKLGFVPDCGEMLTDGLRYTPMTYCKIVWRTFQSCLESANCDSLWFRWQLVRIWYGFQLLTAISLRPDSNGAWRTLLPYRRTIEFFQAVDRESYTYVNIFI